MSKKWRSNEEDTILALKTKLKKVRIPFLCDHFRPDLTKSKQKTPDNMAFLWLRNMPLYGVQIKSGRGGIRTHGRF